MHSRNTTRLGHLLTLKAQGKGPMEWIGDSLAQQSIKLPAANSKFQYTKKGMF
jgi:hypothetical protein